MKNVTTSITAIFALLCFALSLCAAAPVVTNVGGSYGYSSTADSLKCFYRDAYGQTSTTGFPCGAAISLTCLFA